MDKRREGTQDIALAGLLFILFSVKPVEDAIVKFFPSTGTSLYILVGVKCFLFMLTFFVVKNMYLAKKSI
jgi:hypothetical protein